MTRPVHLTRPDLRPTHYTVCGVWAERVTDDHAAVTCAVCRRTLIWRQATAQGDPMTRPVHLGAYPDGPGPRARWVTECQRVVPRDRVVVTRSDVTCGHCRRTEAYRRTDQEPTP